jgi:flagellar hook protein FlgE
MPNSLFTAVSGLLAHQRRLDIVANNLANLNTTAYKTNRGVFADTFYDTVRSASTGNGLTIGGTNPSQIGTGVKVAQINKLFTQGNLESTGQPLDFAMDGEGFFVLNSAEQTVYSRAGSFSLDADNYLVDPSTGAYVQRFGTLGESGQTLAGSFQTQNDQRIQIPIGSVIPGQPTTAISLNGLLDSQAVGPLPQIVTSAATFEAGGSPATSATLLNNFDSNTTPYVLGDSLEFSGTQGDGTPFTSSLSVDNTTTLGAVAAHINTLFTGATASSSASVDTDGVIQGFTAGGQVLPLARLAIATFSNKNGLNAIGGNYFSNTLNSGTAQIGSALSASRGAVRGAQLESSNVDTAYEFTQLIVAQRGFSANARTISVADEVLEELTNIIR